MIKIHIKLGKLALVVLAMLLIGGQAWGATRYLAQSAAGLGNASSCADAAANTSFASATAGDTVFLCGTFTSNLTSNHDGTNATTGAVKVYPALTKYGASSDTDTLLTGNLIINHDYWQLYGLSGNGNGTTSYGVIFAGTSDYGEMHDCTWDDFVGPAAHLRGTNQNITGNKFRGSIDSYSVYIKGSATGASSGVFAYNIIKSSTKRAANRIKVETETGHPSWVFINNEVYCHYGDCWYSSASGGTSELYNNIIVGNIRNANAGHTVTNSNNTILPWGKDPDLNYLTNVTPGAGTLYSDTKKISYSKAGYVSFTIDDVDSYQKMSDLAAIINGYGKHMTWAVQIKGLTETAVGNQALLQSLVAAGNDIASHSFSHPNLTNTTALSVTGRAGSTPTVDIACIQSGDSSTWTGTMLLKEGGSTVKTITLDSLTLAALATSIAAQSGWSATPNAGAGNGNAKSTCLADITGTSVAGATNILFDLDKLHQVEITESKSTLDTLIGGGYSVVSYVYPGNAHDATARAALVTAGYKNSPGVEGTSNTQDKLQSFDIYQYYRYACEDFRNATCGGSADDETSVRCNARALGILAAEFGLGINVRIHASPAGQTLTSDQFTWVIDELLKIPGVNIVSQSEFYDIIKAGWSTSDDITFAKTAWTDASNFKLQPTSPCIDAAKAQSVHSADNTDVDIGALEAKCIRQGLPGKLIFDYPPITGTITGGDYSGNTHIYNCR